MKLKYILQSALFQLRHQKVLSIVTIAGTALAIFLIMVVVMMQEVKTAPFAPESNRDRFLHYSWLSMHHDDWGENDESNGPMSYATFKMLLKPLETPEAVTAYTCWTDPAVVSLPGGGNINIDARSTDNEFWNVFDFTFVDGKPFTQADFDSGIPVAVITESVARLLFGTTEAAGREFLYNQAPYRVSGVVKDVSTLSDKAYAQVWINMGSTSQMTDGWSMGVGGYLSATILARSRDDFDAIREEYQKSLDRYHDQTKSVGMKIISRNRPYDQEQNVIATSANSEPDVSGARRQRFIVYLILLIVPAINLSSMTQSRLRQRTSEIGVRRAFGCRRSKIVVDIVAENLVVTLIAGIAGLVLTVLFAYLCNSLLFAQPFSNTLNPPAVDSSILLHWSTFGWAMLFCFILNLLSSGFPALNAARIGLVNALSGRGK